MQRSTRLLVMAVFISQLFLMSATRADSMSCFEFGMSNSPARVGHEDLNVESEKWCYQSRQDGDGLTTLVFKVGDARPELSALVRTNASGAVTRVTHGSLSQGEITYHAVNNPKIELLPVPFTTQGAVKRGAPTVVTLNHRSQASLEKLWQKFETIRPQSTRIVIKEGEYSGYLPDEKLPYDGYWWSFSDLQLSSGAGSPLGKYDGIITKWDGENPGSQDWENQHHSTQAVAWGGHCNGWAASSVLYPDFTKFLWSEEIQQVVFPSDIKGMLAEAGFCVDYAFYGKRYNSSGDDINDIYPDKFHHVILYYINTAKKPVAFDHYPDDHVDNHVITGYKFNITKESENTFKVDAAIRAHGYNHGRAETGGKAREYTLNLTYTLKTDEEGNLLSGTWDSSGQNPDFLWVPLGQKKCNSENPNLDADKIVAIRDSLPEAKTTTKSVSFSLNRVLQAEEKVELPVPTVRGYDYKIKPTENDLGSEVTLEVTADPKYPSRYNPGPMTFNVAADSTGTFAIPWVNVTKVVLNNRSSSPTTGKNFKLKSIQYTGGGD